MGWERLESLPERSLRIQGNRQILTMYLLDTNHSSRLIDGHPEVVQKLSTLGDVPVAICSIVRGELVFMVHRSERKEENLERITAFFDGVEVLPVDDESADIYGQLKASILHRFGPKEKAKRRKAKIEQYGFTDNDLWIAAVAKRHGLTVVSRDGGFMRIQEVDELKVESWISADATV
jgi:tRNA(fMet)-specific endonuclease VapC